MSDEMKKDLEALRVLALEACAKAAMTDADNLRALIAEIRANAGNPERVYQLCKVGMNPADPAEHVDVLRKLAEARPETAAEARRIIAQETVKPATPKAVETALEALKSIKGGNNATAIRDRTGELVKAMKGVAKLVTDPTFADPSLQVAQVADASGGCFPFLDALGRDRGMLRAVGESDAAYRARICSLLKP